MFIFGKGVPCSRSWVTEAAFAESFVRAHGIGWWPDVEERSEAREGSTETGFMYEERYLEAMNVQVTVDSRPLTSTHYLLCLLHKYIF